MAIKLNQSQHTNFKIHPKMFALYLGFASIIMFFAAMSSALLVKRGDFAHWIAVGIPNIFFWSTLIILISSVSMQIAKNYYSKNLSKFYIFSFITLILGVLFCYMQYLGWQDLQSKEIFLKGNPSGSYIYVISGFHGLHYIGGLLIFLLLILLQYRAKSSISDLSILHINLMTQYWHFIGLLWVYIYLFFKFIIYI